MLLGENSDVGVEDSRAHVERNISAQMGITSCKFCSLNGDADPEENYGCRQRQHGGVRQMHHNPQ